MAQEQHRSGKWRHRASRQERVRYTSAQNVTLASATAGAIIKYTTDGSTPTGASATYTGAINVAATATIKAIATKSGLTDSAVASASYTITTGSQPGAWNLVWNDEFNGTAGSGVTRPSGPMKQVVVDSVTTNNSSIPTAQTMCIWSRIQRMRLIGS